MNLLLIGDRLSKSDFVNEIVNLFTTSVNILALIGWACFSPLVTSRIKRVINSDGQLW